MELTLVILSYWPPSEELINACKSGSVEEAWPWSLQVAVILWYLQLSFN